MCGGGNSIPKRASVTGSRCSKGFSHGGRDGSQSRPHPSHSLRERAPSLSHREREGGAQRRKGEGERASSMSLIVFPAIDLQGGKVVRLAEGDRKSTRMNSSH